MFTSSLQYQVLETSLDAGATIQPTDDALQIRFPLEYPPIGDPSAVQALKTYLKS